MYTTFCCCCSFPSVLNNPPLLCPTVIDIHTWSYGSPADVDLFQLTRYQFSAPNTSSYPQNDRYTFILTECTVQISFCVMFREGGGGEGSPSLPSGAGSMARHSLCMVSMLGIVIENVWKFVCILYFWTRKRNSKYIFEKVFFFYFWSVFFLNTCLLQQVGKIAFLKGDFFL
jgi:hypothetical protein